MCPQNVFCRLGRLTRETDVVRHEIDVEGIQGLRISRTAGMAQVIGAAEISAVIQPVITEIRE
jgi:hypothetical protein